MKVGEVKVACKSRYDDDRYLKKLSKNKYLIYGKSLYSRFVAGFESVDFEGGPFISIGDTFKWLDGEVKEIEPYDGTNEDFVYFKLTVI